MIRWHGYSSSKDASLLGIALSLLILCLSSSNAQNPREPRPQDFQNFETALSNSKKNMCPYLLLGDSRLPIVCWMCRFPHGLHKDKRYAYDCCSGYQRSKEEGNRCISVESTWRNIIDHLKANDKPKTAEALTGNTGIADLTADPSEGVYTVFVPREDENVQRGEMDYTGRDNAARMMVARGRYYSKTFTNRLKIPNENGVDLKVTTYSNGLTFVECQLAWSVDHETTNGVVHYLDGAIPPINLYPNVMARLQEQSDISDFVQALPRDLKDELSQHDSNDWYTVFAPTNQAWRDATAGLGDGESKENLARQHVINRMLCARSVIGETKDVGPTKSDEYITLTRMSDGNTAILDQCNKRIPLTRRDLMSGNGVVHVIGQAITSVRAMDLNGAVSCLGKNSKLEVSRAVQEMQRCGTLSNSKASVVLLPSKEAFQWMQNSANGGMANRMNSNERYRCNVYAHHMLTPTNPGVTVSENRGFTQGQKFHTDFKAGNGAKPFVLTSYSQDPSGNKLSFGAAVVENMKPIRFRDGIIYAVKSANSPPEKTIMELLQSEPDLKEIAKKFADTNMQQEISAMKGNVLFLAPIDQGWRTRTLENAYDTKQNKKLLQLHTVPHALIGTRTGFIGYETIQTVDSMLREKNNGKVKLIMKRNPDGNMFVGHSELPEELWAMVLKWNVVGTDGVIWVIDWPMKCPAFTC